MLPFEEWSWSACGGKMCGVAQSPEVTNRGFPFNTYWVRRPGLGAQCNNVGFIFSVVICFAIY